MAADEKDPNEATTHADLYHRHEPDPSGWEEAEAVTDRPNDTPPGSQVSNSTFADRAKATGQAEMKVVEATDAENKAVQSAEAKKAPAKRTRKAAKS